MSDNALNFALGAISGVDNFLEQKEKTNEEIRKRQAEYEDKIKYYMLKLNSWKITQIIGKQVTIKAHQEQDLLGQANLS